MADASAVVAGRDFLVWTKPWATANVLPAATVAWGTTPGTGWVDAGLTSGGLNASINIPRTDVRVDQLLDPVFRIPTGRDMRLTTDLAEMTPENLNVAAGLGDITVVAPGSGTKGTHTLAIGASVTETYTSIFYDILVPGRNEAFRIMAYKTLSVGNINMQFRDTTAATIHVEAAALPDTSTTPTRIMSVQEVLAALP